MAVENTGSTVIGLVPGFTKHLGGGIAIMYVQGDPTNIVTPAQSTQGALSGGTIAYDRAGNQLYQNIAGVSGATWQKLGSVA